MPPDHPTYTHSVHHDGSSRYVRCRPTGGADPGQGDEVTLRLRAAPGAPIERVLLRTCPDGEQQFVEMQPEEAPAAYLLGENLFDGSAQLQGDC